MDNNVIPFKEPDPKCSFCGVFKSTAKHLFAGATGKYICDKCVAHAKQRLQSVQYEEQINDNPTQ